ncbi:MAG: IreB family regulatory phosphoprotein [Anaerovoracaceae bacterium]
MENRNTIMFDNSIKSEQKTPREILEQVYEALEDRGYNPIDQIVGYFVSGDPSYITSHQGARNLISTIDRDDLIEDIIRHYMNK